MTPDKVIEAMISAMDPLYLSYYSFDSDDGKATKEAMRRAAAVLEKWLLGQMCRNVTESEWDATDSHRRPDRDRVDILTERRRYEIENPQPVERVTVKREGDWWEVCIDGIKDSTFIEERKANRYARGLRAELAEKEAKN